MNQKKTGSLLKELRREKGLTQEQLAEHFNVSGRTVSRWETGSNMPDLSILVEIADYYDVDIREIIDGERKSESMKQEEKETLLLVADYAENEKHTLIKRLRNSSIVGLSGILVAGMMLGTGYYGTSAVAGYITGVSFGLAVGALLVAVFYSTGILERIRKNQGKKCYMKTIAAVCAVIGIVLFIASVIKSV